MKSYKILPVSIKVRDFKLSKEALKRLGWMDWYFSHGNNARATCRHFSVSPDTFYLWKRRFNRFNLSTLEFNTKLRKPHHLRQMTTPTWILQKIYLTRLNNPWMSKYEIHEQLKRQGIAVAHQVIQKVINRHCELRSTEHTRKVRASRKLKIARVMAAKELKEKELGSLVQVDTKHLYILGQRFYVFVAIDCKSRLGFVYPYRSASSANAADFLTRVVAYFPFKIHSINTDNGSEYLLHFHQACESLGVVHYFSHPYTPKMNARVERLIKTLEYEFLHYRDLIPELEDVVRICQEFNDHYNHQRYHQALHYQTPAEYVTSYLQKGEQVYVI